MDVEYIKKLIINSISKLRINLAGLTVLTEAGSNYYLFTPIIAAMAGAKDTYAMIQDSDYGKKENIVKQLIKISDMFGVTHKIHPVFNKKTIPIKKCDIITNLGFVRPINRFFIDNLKRDAVISLMCETWEVRKEDVDLKYLIVQCLARPSKKFPPAFRAKS